MEFVTHSFRHGEAILQGEAYRETYREVLDILTEISDNDLRNRHGSYSRQPMSLSHALNDVLRERFGIAGWKKESPIFQDEEYESRAWRLDFAKAPLSIEVAFNHGEAVAWNLLKPVLASELNHVKKSIQTEVGIVITATKALKIAGAFDGSVGEYEKFIRYLKPLSTVLTVPMVIIGLLPPGFKMKKVRNEGRHTGEISIDLGNVDV